MLSHIIALVVSLISVSAAPSNQRIVNGTDASIEDYPFMISLRSSSGGHSCGGTILSQLWILTAAHCVHETMTPASASIQVGRTEISRPVDESVYEIELVIIHPEYNTSYSFVNDIAVFKLKRPLEFDETVQPVRLPSSCFEVPHMNPEVTLIGWGLNEDAISQTILQQVDYYVVPNEACDAIHFNQIFPQQICAAYPGGGKGQCNGDSGGPLLHNGIQVGIVSWSIKPCTIAPYPGVLTKVSHFIEFIYQHTDLEPTLSSFTECSQSPLQIN
ncbi:chymotrypsin-2-like [Armigeres subalbatus]|uniref:chymotrypsin-2-like n=1 Tax=Armigeres subalbatus TaxID=124917 RepID=UPI002ED58F96